MSVDMTKWCELARRNIHDRPAGVGRMAGKICIVTGAAQGFGKGSAEELYKEGATVVIADMNEPLAKQVAEEFGERAVAIAVNVYDEESVAAMVGRTVELFGGLDLMLSNAGVVRSGPIAQVEKKDFEFVTNINYTGYFLCAKYAAIIMQAQHEADPDCLLYTSILPASGCTTCSSDLSVVVLPAPLRPISPMIVPGCMENETFSSANAG